MAYNCRVRIDIEARAYILVYRGEEMPVLGGQGFYSCLREWAISRRLWE